MAKPTLSEPWHASNCPGTKFFFTYNDNQEIFVNNQQFQCDNKFSSGIITNWGAKSGDYLWLKNKAFQATPIILVSMQARVCHFPRVVPCSGHTQTSRTLAKAFRTNMIIKEKMHYSLL